MNRIIVFLLLFCLLLPAVPLLAQASSSGADCGTADQQARQSISSSFSAPSTVEPTIPAPDALSTEQAPQPQNPIGKTCENGRVSVIVTAERHFGYRTGENVPLIVLLTVDQGVTVDLQSIKAGIVLFQGNKSYDLVGTPVVSTTNKGGETTYRIDITVRFWQPTVSHVFVMNLRYALSVVAATNTPDWRLLVTPDFIVGSSLTVDAGQSLLFNELLPVSVRRTNPDQLFTPIGIVLVLLPLLTLAVLVLRRLDPGRTIPTDELAWRKLLDATRIFSQHGYTRDYYVKINDAIRLWFGMERLDTVGMLDALELRQDVKRIAAILNACDGVIYGHLELPESEHAQIRQWVAEIIRP